MNSTNEHDNFDHGAYRASIDEGHRIEALARELYFAYAQGRHESKSAPPWLDLPEYSEPQSVFEKNYWRVCARAVHKKLEGKR